MAWRNLFKTKSNNILWFDSSIIPFLDEHNEVYQYLSINIEITDKKLAAIELKKNNKQITDSIYYAKKIQDAVLKQSFSLLNIFKDSFILFKPRDIVNGDFYFIKKVGNKLIFTAADCTGHGVPGAFMSLLGISFLNEIIKNEDKLHSSIILDELRSMIKENLGQTGKIIELRNGIDMALCVYDEIKNELEYSGAYNQLYMIRNSNVNEIFEIKADIMPVGTYPCEEKPFSIHKIKIEKNDCLYLLSDGYKDQFGGEKNSKLKSSKVKELLIKNQNFSFAEQKQKLEDFFIKWQGKNPQIDDVVILGVKF